MNARRGSDRPFGADLATSGRVFVTLPRLQGRSVEFVGVRLAAHWRTLLDGTPIRIGLWRSDQGLLVVEHPCWVDHRLAAQAEIVADVGAAIALLEDCCRNPRLSDLTDGSILDNILQVFRATQFQQGFAALVGDVLADWSTLLCPAVAQEQTVRAST